MTEELRHAPVFPQEIFDLIVSHIEPSSRESALNCALASRLLLTARSHVFQSISIPWEYSAGSAQARKIFDLFSHPLCTITPTCVRSLTILGPQSVGNLVVHPYFPEMLSTRLLGVERLTIVNLHANLFSALPPVFLQQIIDLALVATQFPLPLSTDLVDRCTKVQRLYVGDCEDHVFMGDDRLLHPAIERETIDGQVSPRTLRVVEFPERQQDIQQRLLWLWGHRCMDVHSLNITILDWSDVQSEYLMQLGSKLRYLCCYIPRDVEIFNHNTNIQYIELECVFHYFVAENNFYQSDFFLDMALSSLYSSAASLKSLLIRYTFYTALSASLTPLTGDAGWRRLDRQLSGEPFIKGDGSGTRDALGALVHPGPPVIGHPPSSMLQFVQLERLHFLGEGHPIGGVHPCEDPEVQERAKALFREKFPRCYAKGILSFSFRRTRHDPL